MQHDAFQRWASRAGLIGVLVLVGACASPTQRATAPTSGPTSVPKATTAPSLPTLAQEHRRLAKLFDGTPVRLVLDGDGSLRAEVPLRYCFDPARAAVKPPLAALLERLAASPATRGGTWSVAAPGDPKSKGNTLALERAESARDYLIGKGAAALRFSVSALGRPQGQTQGGGGAAVLRVVVTVPTAAAAR